MAMNRNYIVVAALAMVMSSCGLYTKFESPALPEGDLAGESITLPDSSLVALPAWEEYFTDATLQGYIKTALEQNSDMRVAELNVSQAKRQLTTARLAYLPTISLSPEGSVASFDGSSAVRSYNVPITASWEIDIFGRTRNLKQQAKAAYMQSEEYVLMVKTQLIASVAANYYALILADAQLDIAQRSLALLNESLETMIALKEAGMQTQAAVDQTTATVRSFELTVKDLELSVNTIQNSLCLLLNQPPHTLVRGAQIDVPVLPIEQSISLAALSARSDVRVAELQLSQSFYGVNYARASLYPSLRLSGSAGWTNSVGGAIMDPAGVLLSALGSLTQPLFAGNRNRANLENAKDQYEQQLILFEKSLLTAGNEVNDAMAECELTAQKRVIASEQVAALSSAVDATSALMSAGRANYLEVLTAQNSYLSASLNAASITYSEAIAHINLYKALGGGVE